MMTEKDRMDLGRRRREQRARRRKGRGRRALLVFLAAMALTRSVKTAQLRQDAPERDESNWEMAEISGTRPPVEELASAGSETPKMPEELVEVPETPEVLEDDWQLLLVNPWNSMPEGYRVELKRLRNGHAVDARAYPDLQRMLDDCRAAGLRPLICSSYRSQETQQRLYENKIRQLMREGLSGKRPRPRPAPWWRSQGPASIRRGWRWTWWTSPTSIWTMLRRPQRSSSG